MDGKLGKSLARFKERIDNGSYYEAQQTIISITNRYVHRGGYEEGIGLLYEAIMILINSLQFDSAAELFMRLIDILDEEGKGNGSEKIVAIVSRFDGKNENIKDIAKRVSKWKGNSKNVNFIIGKKLVESGDNILIQDGERWLFKSDEIEALDLIINIEIGSIIDGEIGYGICRVIIPYLLNKNIRLANEGLKKMIGMIDDNVKYEDVNGIRVYEGEKYTIVTFIQLLVLLVSKGGNGDIIGVLFKRYLNDLRKYNGLAESVDEVSRIYYGVRQIQQSNNNNMLASMVNGLFGGK